MFPLVKRYNGSQLSKKAQLSSWSAASAERSVESHQNGVVWTSSCIPPNARFYTEIRCLVLFSVQSYRFPKWGSPIVSILVSKMRIPNCYYCYFYWYLFGSTVRLFCFFRHGWRTVWKEDTEVKIQRQWEVEDPKTELISIGGISP